MEQVEVATRTCKRCGETKPLAEFDVRRDTGTHRWMCKACRRSYQQGRWKRTDTRSSRLVGAAELYRCSSCGELKPAADFPRRGRDSTHLQTWCRACFSKYKSERHQRLHDREMRRIRRNKDAVVAANRERLRAYLLEHPCVDCGETDPIVLDLDHVRGKKTADVSNLVASGVKWTRILEEISKCDVRCSNDHRRRTRERFMAKKTDPEVSEVRGVWSRRPRRDSNARPTPSKGAALIH